MDETDRLEALLREAGRDLVTPPTPDISRSLRVPAPNRRQAPILSRRWAVSLLLIIGLLTGLLSAPPVRAQILEFINLGALRIFLSTPTPAPLAEPTLATGVQLVDLPDLSGETTLERAAEQAGFGVRTPADLPEPDLVYFQDLGGPVVLMLWLADTPTEGVRFSLTQLGPGAFAGKDAPESITETTVGGAPALWLKGTHSFFIVDGDMELLRLMVDGNVLVWEMEGVTFRLESELDLDSARRLAESVR